MKRKLCYILIALTTTLAIAAQTTFTHPWTGKRVAFFGDSITDPKNSASQNKYWNLLQEWLHITPYIYAVSGRQWNDIPRQTEQLQKEHGQDVDAIIISIGTNDFNAGVPIGQWFIEQKEDVMAGIHEPKHLVKRLRRIPDMNADTYRGRINIALDKVKRTYPDKQIVLLTPIHRAGFYRNEKNWQPTEEYQNKCGEWISAYVESVKEAGNLWAVPVIDLNALCGLYPLMDEYVPYFNDGAVDRLHPNDKGHERMARTLYYQLSALPIY